MFFKVRIWEKVTICQEVTATIEAENQEDLLQQIKDQSPKIVDWIDTDVDWNTEEHQTWYTNPYEILEAWEEKEIKHG